MKLQLAKIKGKNIDFALAQVPVEIIESSEADAWIFALQRSLKQAHVGLVSEQATNGKSCADIVISVELMFVNWEEVEWTEYEIEI